MPDTPVVAPSPEPITQPNPAPSSFDKTLAVLTNPTVRRLLVFLLGFLTVALNKKLGLELNPESMVTDALLVLGYIGQSAFTDASKARSDAMAKGYAAAAAVTTEDQAEAAQRKP